MNSDPLPEAATSDLPPVLVSPPWIGMPKRTKPVVVDGLTAPVPRIEWRRGERESWLDGWQPGRPPDSDWQAVLARVRAVDDTDLTRHLLKLAAAAPDELGRRLVIEAVPDAWGGSDLFGFLAARFGTDVLPHLTHHAAIDPVNAGHLLLPFLSAAVAAVMADWLVRLKTSRDHAAAWLLRHGTDAAELLIPDALGKPGSPRRNAEAALLFLASRCGHEVVSAAAKRHGEIAATAIKALLDTDPLLILPRKPKRLPEWAEPSALPPLRLRTGKRLPLEAVGHFVTMLSMSKPDQVYAGVGLVREWLDPVSLADFGWGLFQAWKSARFPTVHDWAAVQLQWTADDHTLRKFAKTLRTWTDHDRINAGLAAFSQREGHLEVLYLDELTRTGRHVQLRWMARQRLTELAEQRGLDLEGLRDRLLPDSGLDANGRLMLDFGGRRFTVGLDDELRVTVVDGSGKRRKSLPKPGVRDDARLAVPAQRRFSGLKQDVEVLLTGQLLRWEEAMCNGRRWRPAAFDECFVRHRLLGPVARRLVWLCRSKDEVTPFRVAEDGSLATAEEAEFTMDPASWVSLAHPAEFAEDVARWRELFDDYEILQPFEQLHRRFHWFGAEEIDELLLNRLSGHELSAVRIDELRSRGWERGGHEKYTAKTLCRSISPELQIDVIISPGLKADVSRQTITGLLLTRADGSSTETGFSELPAATLSELIDELTRD